jgi:hypothetical protein
MLRVELKTDALNEGLWDPISDRRFGRSMFMNPVPPMTRPEFFPFVAKATDSPDPAPSVSFRPFSGNPPRSSLRNPAKYIVNRVFRDIPAHRHKANDGSLQRDWSNNVHVGRSVRHGRNVILHPVSTSRI